MGTYFTWDVTSKLVGFGGDGRISEGTCCDHLNKGDQAYGQLSEHDKWGVVMHLVCEECYAVIVRTQTSDLNNHLKRAEEREADRQFVDDTKEPFSQASDYTSIRVMKDMRKPRII